MPGTETIDAGVHKEGRMDQVSATFVIALKEELTRKNIPSNQFIFSDFQEGSPSLIKAIFGVVLQTKGHLYLPGKSISLVSEAVDTVGKGFITVYENRSMSEFHHKYVKVENDHGHINLITESFEPKIATSATTETSSLVQESAALFIARSIYDQINKSNL